MIVPAFDATVNFVEGNADVSPVVDRCSTNADRSLYKNKL